MFGQLSLSLLIISDVPLDTIFCRFQGSTCVMPLLSIREDSDEKISFVYILSNPSFPGLLKVGFTLRDVQQRVDELSASTSVPYFSGRTFPYLRRSRKNRDAYTGVYTDIVNPKKEFFEIHPRRTGGSYRNSHWP